MNPVPKFMATWPSPAVEAIGAMVLLAAALVLWLLYLLYPPLASFVFASGLSYLYERWVDGNGWHLSDFAWRELVIVLVCLEWAWLL